MRRDTFMQACAALAVAAAGGLCLPARAAGSIKMTIPASRGGRWDRTGRALGRALTDAGVASSVGYRNEPGAAGATGLARFIDASLGDRGALLVTGATMVGGIILNKPAVDLDQPMPIARLTRESLVFVLRANSPFGKLADVMAQLRMDPASIRWGGGPSGSVEHIAAALITGAAGVDAARIDYVAFGSASEATAAVLGGAVTIGGGGFGELAPYLDRGELRAIGVTSGERLAGRSVPTFKEQGIDVEIADWCGVYAAPAITEMEKRQLIADVVRATQGKAWLEALRKNGWTQALLTGDAFGSFVEAEFVRLRGLMRKAEML